MTEGSNLEKFAIEAVEGIVAGEVVLATPREQLRKCLVDYRIDHLVDEVTMAGKAKHIFHLSFFIFYSSFRLLPRFSRAEIAIIHREPK